MDGINTARTDRVDGSVPAAPGGHPPSHHAPAGRQRLLLGVAGAVAVALVAAGFVATVWRPVAPPVGPVADAGRWFDDELLTTIASYRRPLYVVVPLAGAIGAVVPLLVVIAGPVRRRLERSFTGPRWESVRGRVAAAVLAGTGVVALSDLLLFGFRFWIGFVHAGHYGLRTQGFAGWLGDLGVTTAVTWLTTALVIAVLGWLVHRAGAAWPLVSGLVLAALSALAVIVWPLVVEPLRFDFTELSPGPTRAAVVEVRDAAGLADAPVLVADASRRTTRRNAYVSGMLGTRRIVLYDTLAATDPDEVAAVVAHEVAHDLNGDIMRGWLLGAGTTVLACAAVGFLLARRAGSFEGGGALARRLASSPSTVATLVAAALVVQALLAPVAAAVSRRAEAAADATALELLDDPAAYAALQRSLVEANLSDPSPPRWWVWWRATHPTPAARLQRAVDARSAGS